MWLSRRSRAKASSRCRRRKRSARVALRAAHADGGVSTDDAALVELAGGTVVIVEGERRNLKLTLPDDLELAQALIEGART